jgi:hypothetical protein
MYPVQHPARSRFSQHGAMHGGNGENDAIVHSPIAASTTQQYPAVEHSSASTPLFQNVYRRKRENNLRPNYPSMQQRNTSEHFYSSVVQTAMKGILLSPVLVLVVWSITAISWTNRQLSLKKVFSNDTVRQRNQPSTSISASPANNRRGWMLGRRHAQASPPQQAIGPHIVQPLYLQEPMQGSAEDYYQDPVPMVGLAGGFKPQPIPLTSNAASNLVVTVPKITSTSGKKQYYYNFPEQKQSPRIAVGDVVNGALPQVVSLNDPVTGKTQYYYTFPEQGKVPDDVASNTQVQTPVVMTAEDTATVESPMDVVAAGVQEDDPALLLAQQHPLQQVGATMRAMSHQQVPHSNDVRHDRNSHHSNDKQNTHHVQYFFYDPKGTKKDQHGHLHLPHFVYDTYGRIVSVTSLTKAAAAPILMQEEPNDPPILMMIHQNATTLNATQYNYTHSHPPVVDTRQKRKMSIPKHIYNFSKTNSESTEDDSSMIICTVGVMALFVGALSARRLRHQRSILSYCIENEALEDDAAYDAAYTTTTHPNAFGSHYNTFAQGWKGDLEKFDV